MAEAVGDPHSLRHRSTLSIRVAVAPRDISSQTRTPAASGADGTARIWLHSYKCTPLGLSEYRRVPGEKK